jgi:hypothetical protein
MTKNISHHILLTGAGFTKNFGGFLAEEMWSKKGGIMGPSKVWFMNARARRFLESTAIKGRQPLEHSGWLERLQRGDIVAVKTHMGEAYNVGYLRPVIISTLVALLKERGLGPTNAWLKFCRTSEKPSR